MMRLEGAKIMISDTTSYLMRNTAQRDHSVVCVFLIVGIDFHVSLLYSQIADPGLDKETAKFLLVMCAFDSAKLLADKQLCKKVRAVWYCPDSASYIEDEHIRQMRYMSRKASQYSIKIMWDKDRVRWETRKFEGCVSVRYAFGEDYKSAMLRTTAFGPQLEEPLDAL